MKSYVVMMSHLPMGNSMKIYVYTVTGIYVMSHAVSANENLSDG